MNGKGTNGCRRFPGLGLALGLFVVPTAFGQSLGGAEVPTSSAETNRPLRVAFSGSMFADLNENDAGAAVRVWAQMLGRDHGIPVDPVVKILQGTNAIAEAVLQRTIDVITLTTEEYWNLRTKIALGSFVFGVKGGRQTEEYLLLVHRESGIEKLADLRGRSLNCFRSPATGLATAWLENLLGLRNQPPLAAYFERVTEFTKLSRVMLPVFFRQADGCVVSRQGFETACELNPQLGKQLKTIAVSPQVVSTVFCFRDDYKAPYREQLLARLKDLNQSPAGRQFLTLFQCDSMREGPASMMAETVELLSTHEQLLRGTNLVIASRSNLKPTIKPGEQN